MNLSEFKAWFEGYTENMDGTPNKQQWERICARVKEIVDAPAMSYPIFIDWYVRPYQPYWPIGPTWISTTSKTISGGDQISGSTYGCQYNSQDAFRNLGRMEANG